MKQVERIIASGSTIAVLAADVCKAKAAIVAGLNIMKLTDDKVAANALVKIERDMAVGSIEALQSQLEELKKALEG